MALFEVEVVFNYGDRHWSNRWDVEADDIATVVGMFDVFHDTHLDLLLNIYTLGRIVARPAGERDAFFETVYNQVGNVPIGSDDPLPLFNTIRVLLNTAVGGRPGQKFLRGLLVAGHLLPSGAISGTILATVFTKISGLIAAVETLTGHIVLTNEKEVVNPSVQSSVQMRQLHRKRKKALL